jgi:hypothetical protein
MHLQRGRITAKGNLDSLYENLREKARQVVFSAAFLAYKQCTLGRTTGCRNISISRVDLIPVSSPRCRAKPSAKHNRTTGQKGFRRNDPEAIKPWPLIGGAQWLNPAAGRTVHRDVQRFPRRHIKEDVCQACASSACFSVGSGLPNSLRSSVSRAACRGFAGSAKTQLSSEKMSASKSGIPCDSPPAIQDFRDAVGRNIELSRNITVDKASPA